MSSPPTYLITDAEVVSVSWPLWTVLQGARECAWLSETLISFPPDLYPEITGSDGSSTFNFLRNLHAVFHRGCTSLHSHQQCAGFPSLHMLTNRRLFSLVFLVFAIQTGVRCLLVLLICVFPDGEWCWASFHVSGAHLYVIFAKMSIQVLCPFLNLIICLFLLLSCMCCLQILDISRSSDVWFVDIFCILYVAFSMCW